jgi:hypothetical protein
MGPILIFDKSTLESLNPDEACWLENFFLTNITPPFFTETLADLRKEMRSGQTPEEIVGNLAYKTPVLNSYLNVHHATLCTYELLGHRVEMDRVPAIAGGVNLTTGDRKGIVYKQSPEEEAFQRWQCGEFLDLERNIARIWRDTLASLDLNGIYKSYQMLFTNRVKPKTLREAKIFTDEFMNDKRNKEQVFHLALTMFCVPAHPQYTVIQRWITQRWNFLDKPLLKDFAPYTTHVVSVDLFFFIAIAADLISRERPSNKIDLSYLYYLPFCMIFTSNDKLHNRVATLFIKDDQTFISGRSLKEDLRKLDNYYSRLPEDIKAKGIMKFAYYPPTDSAYLVTQLWDKHLPKWRESASRQSAVDVPIDKEVESKLLEHMKRFENEARPMGSIR